MSDNDYNDFVTFEPHAVLVVRDEKKFAMFFDPKYEYIFYILREGPQTLKEITEKHKEYTLKDKKDKKEITIYRYLKDLVEVGLVVQAGKRVYKDKIATDTLYNRAALMFYPVIISEEYWKREENEPVLKKLAEMISLYTGKPKPSLATTRDLISNMYKVGESVLGKFLEEKNEEISKILGDYTFGQMDLLLRAFDMIVILLNSQFYDKEMEEIFGK